MRYFEDEFLHQLHFSAATMRGLILAASALVLPLALLLFAQWPLRDGLQSHAREANDGAQILFALYAAVAITAATRSGSHLCLARHNNILIQGNWSWRLWGLALCVVPWALFLLWTSVPPMLASVARWESFSEGLTPGYFLLRIALVLLPIFVLIEMVYRLLLNGGWLKNRHPSP
jgi:TRAP-type C4-dicarboxylate transport system permease small subunit